MLKQSHIERERYESRQKALRDRNTDIAFAEMTGAIHFCQQVLHLPETPTAQLMRMQPDDVKRLLDELKQRVQPRE